MRKGNIIYTGSYCSKEKAGIHGYKISEDGILTCISQAGGIDNPSYLAVSKDKKNLYGVSEVMSFENKPEGAVASYLRGEDDSLRLLNVLSTGGTGPCHVLVDDEKEFLYVANYMGGSVAMFSLNKDGSLKDMDDLKQHQGSGPNKERQEGPHLHFVEFSFDKKGLWCVDLGLDAIKYYEIDKKERKLIAVESKDVYLPKGTGVRHIVIDKINENLMYAICELSSEVMVINIGQAEKVIQRISTLPENVIDSTCAALKMSSDGRFLYASNRGDDSIAVCSRNLDDGLLLLVEITKTLGETPRDFSLVDGFVVVGNQNSNTIEVFKVDAKTGAFLSRTHSLSSQAPVCVVADEI